MNALGRNALVRTLFVGLDGGGGGGGGWCGGQRVVVPACMRCLMELRASES